MRWKVLKSTEMLKAGLFRLRVDECQLPDGRVNPRYYVLEFPDWVNVLPVTEDGNVVLVEQYRHASDDLFLEIPGGSTNHGGEDPAAAGKRELLEETGYQPSEFINCGFHYPNPALQNNRMHTFLALGCQKVREPELDPFEDLRTVIMPLKQMIAEWENGRFKHSLISASIGLCLKPLRERGWL